MASRMAKRAEELRGTFAGVPQLSLANTRSFQATALTFTTEAAVATGTFTHRDTEE